MEDPCTNRSEEISISTTGLVLSTLWFLRITMVSAGFLRGPTWWRGELAGQRGLRQLETRHRESQPAGRGGGQWLRGECCLRGREVRQPVCEWGQQGGGSLQCVDRPPQELGLGEGHQPQGSVLRHSEGGRLLLYSEAQVVSCQSPYNLGRGKIRILEAIN